MNYNHKKICAWCGNEFYSQRDDALFCNSSCRSNHFNSKQKMKYGGQTIEAFETPKREEINDSDVYSGRSALFCKMVDTTGYSDREIRRIMSNRKAFLNFFLLSHREEIMAISHLMEITSTDKYTPVKELLDEAYSVLYEIKDLPSCNEYYEEINEIVETYESIYEDE